MPSTTLACAMVVVALAATARATVTGCMYYYATADCTDTPAHTTCGTFTSGACIK